MVVASVRDVRRCSGALRPQLYLTTWPSRAQLRTQCTTTSTNVSPANRHAQFLGCCLHSVGYVVVHVEFPADSAAHVGNQVNSVSINMLRAHGLTLASFKVLSLLLNGAYPLSHAEVYLAVVNS